MPQQTNPQLTLKQLRADQIAQGPTWADLARNQGYWDFKSYGLDPYDRNHHDFSRLPMSSDRDPRRGTGRTSDMLWEASKVKDEGEEILVLVHNERMISHCVGVLRGGWWGLVERDFLSVERAARDFRGYRLPERIFKDHFIETLRLTDRMFAEAYNRVEEEAMRQIEYQRGQRYIQMPKFPCQP